MNVAHEMVVGQTRELVDRWDSDMYRSKQQELDFGMTLGNHASSTNFEQIRREDWI